MHNQDGSNGVGGGPDGHPEDRVPAPHAVIEGRYELLEPVGSGGMGEVWKSYDRRLRRFVAVKGLLDTTAASPDTKRAALQRARREAEALAKIEHQNVVTVHDQIETADQVWIVMKLLEGRSLADLLSRDGVLGVPRAADIGLQMAQGLRAVHEAAVLHRDVKPGNVLVRDGGQVVLVDFGIATFEGAEPRHPVRRGHRHTALPGARTLRPRQPRPHARLRPVGTGRHPVRDGRGTPALRRPRGLGGAGAHTAGPRARVPLRRTARPGDPGPAGHRSGRPPRRGLGGGDAPGGPRRTGHAAPRAGRRLHAPAHGAHHPSHAGAGPPGAGAGAGRSRPPPPGPSRPSFWNPPHAGSGAGGGAGRWRRPRRASSCWPGAAGSSRRTAPAADGTTSPGGRERAPAGSTRSRPGSSGRTPGSG